MKFNWITSDTHFFHENIIGFCRPQFSNVQEMNEIIIENWNNVVKRDDKVIHLGHFALGGEKYNEFDIMGLIMRLNGHIHLVAGNHDSKTKLQLYAQRMAVMPPFTQDGCWFTHNPIHSYEFDGDRDARGYIHYNVHGHMHDHDVGDRRYFNAGIDQNDMNLFAYDDVMQRLRKHKDDTIPF